MKLFAPLMVYGGVILGLFFFRNAWAALLTFHLAIIISVLIAKPDMPLKILVTGRNLKWTLLTVILCGSTGVTLSFFWDKFGISRDIATSVETMGLTRLSWIPFIVYFTLVNPILEEYFWRVYLGSKSTNFAASDFWYAGFHGLILIDKVRTDMIVYSLAVLVLAGWFWRQIARIDGGLRAPLLGHMAADFSILTAVYLNLYR
jgi:membrane protease YdiL (CAAX protease family)